MTGTHQGCGEGGCGICTVAMARKDLKTGRIELAPLAPASGQKGGARVPFRCGVEHEAVTAAHCYLATTRPPCRGFLWCLPVRATVFATPSGDVGARVSWPDRRAQGGASRMPRASRCRPSTALDSPIALVQEGQTADAHGMSRLRSNTHDNNTNMPSYA